MNSKAVLQSGAFSWGSCTDPGQAAPSHRPLLLRDCAIPCEGLEVHHGCS